MSFPAYNSRDMMRAQYKLVTEGLHLAHLLAVAGASMGADQALQLAVLYPGFMDGILSLSGGALWSSGVLFFGPLMQSVIESCAGWENGNYEAISSTCGANAVSVLVPYFYTRDWWDTNIKTPEAFSRWRKEMGDYYLDVQDARDLYHLSKALGRAFIGDSPGFNGDAGAALGSIRARTLFIVSPQDPFLPRHMEAQVKLIPNARMVSIDSIAGHFACCGADRQATAVVSKAMRRFLGDLVRPRTR